MKHTRKILIALVVVMTLLMTLAVIPASAAGYVTLKGSFDNWGGGYSFAWVSGDDWALDAYFEKGSYKFKVVCDDKWYGGAGFTDTTTGTTFSTSGGDATFTASGGTYRFVFNASTGKLVVTRESTCTNHTLGNNGKCTVEKCQGGYSYTVAGTLNGNNWTANKTEDDMTYDTSTGIYTKVYENVKAGTYEFKCAQNHNWSVSYPSNNYSLTVAKDGSTVTITLNDTTVTATVTEPECQHNYKSETTATCTTAGKTTYTCSVCSHSFTEDTPALGHYYKDGDCIRCDATTEYTTVYVKNDAEWAEVYCYTWIGSTNSSYIAWPGEKMTLGEDGLWSAQIPAGYEKVIFNVGSNLNQTTDLPTPTNDAVIFNNKDNTWSAPPHVCSYTVPATCTEPPTCSGCGAPDPNGSALGHENNANCTHTLVKLDNIAKWDKVCCYYWIDDNNNTWPGQEMNKGTDGYYYFYLPEDVTNIIFTNGINNVDGEDKGGKETKTFTAEDGKIYANYIVSLSGDMNSWTPEDMTISGGVATITVTLEAGTYKFKLIDNGAWLGNTGTIEDSTAPTSEIGWEMTDTGDCTLEAKGGIYTFKFNLETKHLIVEWVCIHSDKTDDGNHTCDICGVENVTEHSYTIQEVIAPTCTEVGYTKNKCECGEETNHSDEVAATGHSKSTTTVAPTCVAEGYDLTTCANCSLEETSNFVSATGNHTYVDFACSVCSAAMPAVESDGGKKVYDFNTEDGFTAIQADAYIALSGKFRLNDGGCYQMYPADEEKGTPASKIQLVVPAHRSVTIEGHSAGYGKLYVKINDEIKEITTGSLTFETSEETKVEITAVNDSNSYIKSITVEIPKIISTDANLTFHEGGTYNDYGIDFSGININNAGRTDNAQVKEGSFTFNVKAGAVVTILSYHDSSLVSYKINGGEEINAEKYYIYAVTDSTITYTPVNNNNYLVSIEIKFHEGLKLVPAVAATCTAGGNEAYYDCDCCEGTLTEKVELDALGHDEVSHEAKAPTCSAIGWDAYVTCSRCDYTTYVEKAALGHSWVDATCTAPKTCSVCSMTDGAAAGHSWVDATCTAPKTCSKCSATEGEALGHAWDDGVVTTQPTCAVEGVKTFSCANCDETKTEAVPVVDHTYYYTLCLVCYAPNPYYIQNDIKVGENKVVCNQYHLVANGEGQHGKPFEFPFITIEKDGVYKFSSNDNISIFVYTIEITTEGADFSDGGASWGAVDMDGEVELKAGKYYVGFIYLGGEGEYTVTVELVPPHEHNFVEGKCECGESDPNYVPPVDPKPVDPQPEPELNFFQKIWQAILAFFQKILGMFKK